MANPTTLSRAQSVEEAFRVAENVHLVGSMEKGVTVYGQQVRAINLVWALSQIDADAGRAVKKIGVVGGGIAGLTAVACARVLYPTAKITLFEKNPDLASLQQGCDTRWLHPRIYQWPDYGSRAPSASLPLLNWSEGRASDVAHQVLTRFSRYTDNVEINVSVEHLQIDAASCRVQWIGRRGAISGAFVRETAGVGDEETFDRLILTLGFGLEQPTGEFPTASYWRNETLGQVLLTGGTDTYLISGYGDGALVDLCRLSIERFRQDRILYDLFETQGIDHVEERLRELTNGLDPSANLFVRFHEFEKELFGPAKEELERRLRKDTRVILHLTGRNKNTKIEDAFGPTSSFANRLLLFLLYRCGAFVPRFTSVPDAIEEHRVPKRNVLCRYGPTTFEHVVGAFADQASIRPAIQRLKDSAKQSIKREWTLGSIPTREIWPSGL